MEQNPSRDIAVYMVWSPQRGAEERHVADAAALMPDPRVVHSWDPDMVVGTAYAPVVDASRPLWDFWMLFGRDAVWSEGGPPDPAWWEHQLAGLDLPPERRLDPERFAEKAAQLLGQAPPASVP